MGFEVTNNLLVIKIVTVEDNGKYVCELENENGELERFAINLKVLKPAKAQIRVGYQLTVKSRTSLSVTCSGLGVPLPEVIWRRHDVILSSGNGITKLVLDEVARSDIGDFVCQAENGVGDEDSKTLQLDVLFAPEVDSLKA